MATDPAQIKKKAQFAQITVYVTGLVRQGSIFKRIMCSYGAQLDRDSYLGAYEAILSKIEELSRKKDSLTDADLGGLVALIYKHERIINERFKSAELSGYAYKNKIYLLFAFTPLRGMVNSLRVEKDLVQTPKEDYLELMNRSIDRVAGLDQSTRDRSISELEAAIKKKFGL